MLDVQLKDKIKMPLCIIIIVLRISKREKINFYLVHFLFLLYHKKKNIYIYVYVYMIVFILKYDNIDEARWLDVSASTLSEERLFINRYVVDPYEERSDMYSATCYRRRITGLCTTRPTKESFSGRFASTYRW